MHRPFGAGHDPVVVEDAQRADTHLLRIAVAIEGEVPAGVEPSALLVPDRVRLSNRNTARLELHQGNGTQAWPVRAATLPWPRFRLRSVRPLGLPGIGAGHVRLEVLAGSAWSCCPTDGTRSTGIAASRTASIASPSPG